MVERLAGVREVDESVGEIELEADIRIVLQERRQHGGDSLAAQRDWCGYTHQSARGAGEVFDAREALLDAREG